MFNCVHVHLVMRVNLFAEKYFEMSRKQCRDGLNIYKAFVLRMEGVGKFLKTAEVTGAS